MFLSPYSCIKVTVILIQREFGTPKKKYRMRNHAKPRDGTKGGLGGGLQEPNLSGAYIRSLVKQLASSRKHVNPGGLYPTSKALVKETAKIYTCAQAPTQIDQENGKMVELSSNLDEQSKSAINPVVLQQRKQVRRRPHTRKQSQECLLNIAEARREIVAALHLHRAANGSATKPPPNPIIKPARVNTRNSPPSKHSTSAKQSAGSNSTRCNSCMSKVMSSSTTTTQRACNEAKAITICGHLLCWMCLNQCLQNFSSSSIFKGCPVCAKPLNMGTDIFPITLGVPIRQASHESGYASPVLQSAPLLINQLPAAQPAWSTTGPSLLPMSSGMDISQNPSLNQHENMANPPLNPTTLTAASCSGPPERPNLGLPNIEQGLPKNWHVAVDDEELAQIRSLGEQHDMEWNDTVNLATTTRWFKFLRASELPNSLYEWETERNDNISLQKIWETPIAKFECKDDVGFDAEEPLISDFMDRSTIKECLHILPELPLETMWLDDWFDYHDCIQGFTNQQNYDETHPLDCCDDTTIHSELGSENPESARVSRAQLGSKEGNILQP